MFVVNHNSFTNSFFNYDVPPAFLPDSYPASLTESTILIRVGFFEIELFSSFFMLFNTN